MASRPAAAAAAGAGAAAGAQAAPVEAAVAVPFPGQHGGKVIRWMVKPRSIVQAGKVIAYLSVARAPGRPHEITREDRKSVV